MSPGNSRLSVKWMLNCFRLVKCSSLFFPLFLYLVVQVQDVFKDVCMFSFLFCVVLSHHCMIPYLNTKCCSQIKKGWMETQQRGSLCISFIIFAFFPPSRWGEQARAECELPQQNLLVPHPNFPVTNTEIIVKERYTLASFYFYPDFKQSSIHYIYFEQQFRDTNHI